MIRSYEQLTLGKYEEIVALLKDQTLDDLQLQAEVIGILNDKTADEVLSLPLEEYQMLAYAAKFLEEGPEPKPRCAKSYNLAYTTSEGKREELVLIPTCSARQMTTAQYIDFQNFNAQGDKITETLSCLLVPLGKRYCEDYDPAEVQAAIRKSLPVLPALHLLAFFFESCARLTRATLISSWWALKAKRNKTEKEKEELRKIRALLKNGAGPTQ